MQVFGVHLERPGPLVFDECHRHIEFAGPRIGVLGHMAADRGAAGGWNHGRGDRRGGTASGTVDRDRFVDRLEDVAQLRPVLYTYKGNDTSDAPAHLRTGITEEDVKKSKEALVVPYPNSPHHAAAQQSRKFAGLVAQEVETIIPEMVKQRNGYIDGAAVNDLRDLDTTPLIFALVNAIKELKLRVEELETR